MRGVQVRLFGRFEVLGDDGAPVHGLEGRKVKELLALLLLSNGKPLQRERIAEQLWADIDPVRSKKYLRQALWQLQRELREHSAGERITLEVEQDWIAARVDPTMVDAYLFDSAYRDTIALPQGEPLSPDTRQKLLDAAALYRGDLLEGWYCDWSLPHQDGFRSIALLIFDKLLQDAERACNCEMGYEWARRALELDPANERTHVRMMRLYVAVGDRTAALRQFRTCQATLKEHLGVEPQQSTHELYTQIRDGHTDRGPDTVTTRASHVHTDHRTAPNRTGAPDTRGGVVEQVALEEDALLARLQEISRSVSFLTQEIVARRGI